MPGLASPQQPTKPAGGGGNPYENGGFGKLPVGGNLSIPAGIPRALVPAYMQALLLPYQMMFANQLQQNSANANQPSWWQGLLPGLGQGIGMAGAYGVSKMFPTGANPTPGPYSVSQDTLGGIGDEPMSGWPGSGGAPDLFPEGMS